jgi:hypothetical protein
VIEQYRQTQAPITAEPDSALCKAALTAPIGTPLPFSITTDFSLFDIDAETAKKSAYYLKESGGVTSWCNVTNHADTPIDVAS